MCTIISDSSTLYTSRQARENGFYVCPLQIQLKDGSYADLDEISSDQVLERIEQGDLPTTSQPALGAKMELYEKNARHSDVIDICMADGLSGTYQSSLMARTISAHPEKIHVFNTRTLCGPHRGLVQKANQMNREGKKTDEIMEMLEKSAQTEMSFLIPFDFSFLKRGGRVRGMEAGLGSLLKLVPVMKKTEDGMHLEKAAVTRTLKKALSLVAGAFQEAGMNSDYTFYVTHARNPEAAGKARQILEERFPGAKILEYPLSPAFIAQGGPGALAIQAIRIA